MQVFTLGYQGLSLESYAETLIASNIGIVLDVREVAWSYNRRYIKSVLQKTLFDVGIKYVHLKACGNPSSNRKTASSVDECLSRYRNYLQENKDCVEVLLKYVSHASEQKKPACLTCYERLPQDCHRLILLEALREIVPELQICHLQAIATAKTTNQTLLFSDTTIQLL